LQAASSLTSEGDAFPPQLAAQQQQLWKAAVIEVVYNIIITYL
jgi:hypothetical protein